MNYRVAFIIRLGIEIVITVLVVDGKDIAQLVTRLGKKTHSIPAASFGTGRQNVGMEVVVAAKAPAIQMNVGALYAFDCQFTQMSSPFVETHELMVFRRIVLVVVT